jgi:hypothetical protein
MYRPGLKSAVFTEFDARLAAGASMQLRDLALERGWELPPEHFEVTFEHEACGAVVTLIAEDEEGASLSTSFRSAPIDPEAFDAAVFLPAFQQAGLVPEVFEVEIVPQQLPTAH